MNNYVGVNTKRLAVLVAENSPSLLLNYLTLYYYIQLFTGAGHESTGKNADIVGSDPHCCRRSLYATGVGRGINFHYKRCEYRQ
ncbi:MAG: hypothetical protein WAW02_07985 [Sideroxyarcus sp.]